MRKIVSFICVLYVNIRHGVDPRPASTIGLPTRALAAVRPFSSDLQIAETKSKSNLTNSSDAKGSTKAGGLSAMARNLTKKTFGSRGNLLSRITPIFTKIGLQVVFLLLCPALPPDLPNEVWFGYKTSAKFCRRLYLLAHTNS